MRNEGVPLSTDGLPTIGQDGQELQLTAFTQQRRREMQPLAILVGSQLGGVGQTGNGAEK
jgi:hypothetical protein